MKNRSAFLNGALYVVIAAIPPALAVLQSDTVLTARVWSVIGLSSLAASANALKAFLSQSASKEPAAAK